MPIKQKNIFGGIFRAKSTKPVFSVKIDQDPFLFWSKPHFFQSKSTKPFSANINQTHFFQSKTSVSGQNRRKPGFPVKINPKSFFRSKPSFLGQGRPKPGFLTKIDKAQFFGQNCRKAGVSAKINQAVFSGQNRTTPVFFCVKNYFFQSKSPKTSFFGQNRGFAAKISRSKKNIPIKK